MPSVKYTRRFDWPAWFCDAVSANKVITHGTGKWAQGECYADVRTLWGWERANENDIIIRDADGSFRVGSPGSQHKPAESTFERAHLDDLEAVAQEIGYAQTCRILGELWGQSLSHDAVQFPCMTFPHPDIDAYESSLELPSADPYHIARIEFVGLAIGFGQADSLLARRGRYAWRKLHR